MLEKLGHQFFQNIYHPVNPVNPVKKYAHAQYKFNDRIRL
jgi:hypothetical protein